MPRQLSNRPGYGPDGSDEPPNSDYDDGLPSESKIHILTNFVFT